MRVYRTWLDAISDNVANSSTIRSTDEAAYQERFVVAQSAEAGGAVISGARFGDPDGRLVYDPNHPLADDNGFVRAPDMDLTDQMTSLIIAQRAYQANVTVFERARDAYLRALEIGN
jgi:flagellar basal-body rod protein FlgC